jgi:UPF0271 protein
MSPRVLDLNCDLGEGCGGDAAIMPYVTSASIACGGHAGDESTMRETVALARHHGVAIGAHPGFADREHFGRRELDLPLGDVASLVTAQIMALQAIAPVVHVKPHGALYNLAARDPAVARAIAEAVRACGEDLILVGLSGSELTKAGAETGLRVAHEVFADRTYRFDGSLTARSRPDALIGDSATAVAQAILLAQEGVVRTVDGTLKPLRADTLFLHGDGPNAVRMARRLHAALKAARVTLRRQGG